MPEQPIYLDHAATTPLRESARSAWLEAQDRLSANPGNPNALHNGGRAARQILEEARVRLADALDCDPGEVIFTSGATESAAIGVAGSALARVKAASTKKPIVLGSGIDHPSVREQKKTLAAAGVTWVDLPVASDGVTRVDPVSVGLAAGEGEPVLATLGLVCSETGVIQPVEELSGSLRELSGDTPLLHTDATQAVENLPVSFRGLGVDLMTIGGHKFGAPVGTGALVVSRGVSPVSDRPGGGQERGIRSGTQDVAGALALSVAAEEAQSTVAKRQLEHRLLRAYLLRGLPAGVSLTTGAESVDSIVHLSLPTTHPEVILLEMDRSGICISAGSACHAGVTRPSPVILSMGRSEEQALGVLRVSFGASTTTDDIDGLLGALPGALALARRMDVYEGERNTRKRVLQ